MNSLANTPTAWKPKIPVIPADKETQIGNFWLAKDLPTKLQSQVKKSMEAGAKFTPCVDNQDNC